MFCKLGLDKLVLRSYELRSYEQVTCELERANESQSELEWARVTVTEWARDKARVSQKEQVWSSVSQSWPKKAWLTSNLLTAHHARQWGGDWLTKRNVKIWYCLVLNPTLVSYLCKDDDGDVFCQCKHSRGELFLCKRPLWPPSLCASWSSKTVLFMQNISK